MFAGRMKLKHFLALLGGGAAAVGVGSVAVVGSMEGEVEPEPVAEVQDVRVETAPAPAAETARPTRAAAPPATPAPAAATSAAPEKQVLRTEAPAAPAVEPWEKALFALAGKDLGTKKKKDLRPAATWKVNVYQDSGHATVNRAKVDFDRDEQWDEKWTFDGAAISKKVSPNDDGDYTAAFDWDGSAWKAR